jgi:hypothetical protein
VTHITSRRVSPSIAVSGKRGPSARRWRRTPPAPGRRRSGDRVAVVPERNGETLLLRHRPSFRPAVSLVVEGLLGGGMTMLATYAGIGLIFIAVVALAIVATFYVMLRQTH